MKRRYENLILLLKTITTIPEYCKEVNISPPKHPIFDIRRFEDKVKTENKIQQPFRHEFYAIALRHAGFNKHVNGALLNANLFFNSPYQVISWDVLPHWKGWYIMFGEEFLALNPAWNNFITDYPFFRLDKAVPFNLPGDDAKLANIFFEKIFEEYHSGNEDKFQLIQSYTSVLLQLAKRYFSRLHIAETNLHNNRTTDILLLSRFQIIIETTVATTNSGDARKPSFYAKALHVHPNYLNAVVKRITGKTASSLIQSKTITLAKSLLMHSGISIKEIAFRLHFNKPTHFNAYFKKLTGSTPKQYRQAHLL